MAAVEALVKPVSNVVTSVMGLFTQGKKTEAVKADARARIVEAQAQRDIARIGFLSIGTENILGYRNQELAIQLEQVKNEGRITPVGILFILAGLFLLIIGGIWFYKKLK